MTDTESKERQPRGTKRRAQGLAKEEDPEALHEVSYLSFQVSDAYLGNRHTFEFKIDNEHDTRPTKFTRASDPELDSGTQNEPSGSSASAPISISLSHSKADNTDAEVTGGKTHVAALTSSTKETSGTGDAENEGEVETAEEPNTRTEPTSNNKGSINAHEQSEGRKDASGRAQQSAIDEHPSAKVREEPEGREETASAKRVLSMFGVGTKGAEVSDEDESPSRVPHNKPVASVGGTTHNPAMSPLAKVRPSNILLALTLSDFVNLS